MQKFLKVYVETALCIDQNGLSQALQNLLNWLNKFITLAVVKASIYKHLKHLTKIVI
jgi:hypothetical protein